MVLWLTSMIFYSPLENRLYGTTLSIFRWARTSCWLGGWLNILVMGANGFKMPVIGGASDVLHRPLAGSQLQPLADIFVIQETAFSIGDILISIGGLVMIICYITDQTLRHKPIKPGEHRVHF